MAKMTTEQRFNHMVEMLASDMSSNGQGRVSLSTLQACRRHAVALSYSYRKSADDVLRSALAAAREDAAA